MNNACITSKISLQKHADTMVYLRLLNNRKNYLKHNIRLRSEIYSNLIELMN